MDNTPVNNRSHSNQYRDVTADLNVVDDHSFFLLQPISPAAGEWISEHIRDPKSHKPDSRMPGYASKIQAQDLRSLAEYLASLK